MNGWWLGIASLAACGSKSVGGPVGTVALSGTPSGTPGGGTSASWTGTGMPTGDGDTGYVGTQPTTTFACGPTLSCDVGFYCSVVVPGVPPTGTGTTDPNSYTCVVAPPGCGGVATCACIGCGGLTGTGTIGPYLCEEVPSVGATCTMYAP